jgi:glutathione S-transferase
MEECGSIVWAQMGDTNFGDKDNAPPYAPPILKHGELLIPQTSNILMYLAPRLGLAPTDDALAIYRLNALVLTALDGLSNEIHDTHHPIAKELSYEDQKAEALRRSQEFVKTRLPKHLGYFERVLKGEASGDGPWLHNGTFTYADLVMFQVNLLLVLFVLGAVLRPQSPTDQSNINKQCIDGTLFAFPKVMAAAKESGKYDRVFTLYEAVKARPRIAAYLTSERRQKYSMGIYRYYEEMDVIPAENK